MVYCPTSRNSSHSWVFASEVSQEFATGAGLDHAIPDILSSHQSELGGLLAVLYIIYKVCNYYGIKEGKAIIYSDNKGALSAAFNNSATTLSSYMAPDYDLIELCHHILQFIPITILHEWVKGHYTGKQPQLKHRLNHTADRIAVDHRKHQPRCFKSQPSPLLLPGFKVCLRYHGAGVTSQHYQLLSKEINE
jgi:hypothetical protein